MRATQPLHTCLVHDTRDRTATGGESQNVCVFARASSYSCFSILISSFYCSLHLVLFFPCRQMAEQRLRYPLGDGARLREPSRRTASRHTARVIAAKDRERVTFLISQKYLSFEPAFQSTCEAVASVLGTSLVLPLFRNFPRPF